MNFIYQYQKEKQKVGEKKKEIMGLLWFLAKKRKKKCGHIHNDM